MKTKILIQLETWYLSINKVGAHEGLDKVRALSYKAISKAAKYENDSVLNSEILLSISLRDASTCEDLSSFKVRSPVCSPRKILIT